MKTKHSIWKSKLVKTMSLTIVILVAALFLGTAASAGLTPQAKTQTMNKKESNTQTTARTGIHHNSIQSGGQTPFQPIAPLGEVIFSQGYYLPTDPWNFYTSDVGLGYLVQEDFWDVTQDIGDIEWYGLDFNWNTYVPGNPDGMTFNIIFYEDNAGVPGAEVANFASIQPTFVDTGIAYSSWGDMWYWQFELPSTVPLSAGWVGIQSTYCPDGSMFLWATGPDGNSNGRQNGANTGANFAYSLTAPNIQYDHDIAISSIVKPVTGNAAPITPTVKVKNNGLYTETYVDIQVDIGKELITGTLEDFEATNGGYTHFPKLPQPDAWEYGAPTSGPMAAYSGSNLWATTLAGNYPPSMWCSLVSAPFTVQSGTFSFWHWYYFEQNYDGGNVKISNDGGANWVLMTPIGNYPGTMSYNPFMTGQPAYNGQSGSWKKAEFVLTDYFPVDTPVNIMWETASDSSVQYAGWYIDDVGFTVTSWVNVYSDIQTILSIAPGEILEVPFTEWTSADLGLVQNTNINYNTEATNLFADQNINNDYKAKPFTLHFGWFNDVKVNAINSPVSGLANPQMPEVAIENVGQFDQSANVNMVISKIQYGAQWTQESSTEWGQSNSNNAGGTPPEAMLNYYLIQGDYAYLMSCPIDTSAEPTLTLSFRSMINNYAGGYNCYIKTRSSESDDWTDVSPWTNPITASIPAAQYTINIDGDIGTATQVMFEFSGYYFNLNYWYIDDFVCGPYSTDFSGTFPPVQVSLISEYDSTVTVDIPAGETMNVSGFDLWTPEDLPFAMGIDYDATATVTLNGFTPIYNYGFEDWVPTVPPGPVVFPPAGWTVINANGDYTTWTQYTGGHTGTYCASISYHYPTDDDWLTTNPIIVPGGGGMFSFWWKCGSTYYAEHFKVYYSTSGNTVADFTGPNGYVIGDITYNADTNWHQFTYYMSSPEQVWFAVYIDSADALRLSVDDFAFPDGTTQGFDEGTPGVPGHWPGWTIINYGVADQWFGVTSGSYPTCSPPEGVTMAEYNSWDVNSGNAADLLQTGSPVDFTSATQMKLKMMHGLYNAADVIYPLLSVDGINWWYDGTGFYQYDGTTGWKEHTMDYSLLINYLGGPGYYYIGFEAISDYGYNMFIDDISVSIASIIPDGNPADNTMSEQFTLSYEHDVGVATITEPSYIPPKTGDIIFHQGYWGPDDAWAFDTSGMALGYLVYEDFFGLVDPIGDVSFWGIPLANNGGWIQTDPALLVFDVIFYEDNAGLPGAVVATFTGLSATFEDTGIQYAGLYEMFKWYVTLPEAVEMTAGWISIQSEIPADNGNLMWATGPDGNLNAQQLQSGVLVPLGQNMAYDLGKAEVAPPGGNWPPGTYQVAGIVKNLGVTYTESNFDVNTQITNNTGVVVYDNTVTVVDSLAPGATAVVTFPDITIENVSSAEGTYKVTMKTMLAGDDHTNNDKKTMTFVIEIKDITPPITTATVAGTMGLENWYISSVSVTLTAIDPAQGKWPSGVNHTYLKDNSGEYEEVTLGEANVITGDGQHTVYYYSVDKAGNVETAKTVSFQMDTTKPEWINYTCTPLNLLKTKWLCVANVTDATSGVVLVQFFVDEALVGNATELPYTFTYLGKATNFSQGLAYDEAGNSALSNPYVNYDYGSQQQSYPTVVVQSLKLKNL